MESNKISQKLLKISLFKYFEECRVIGSSDKEHTHMVNYQKLNYLKMFSQGYTLKARFTVEGRPWGIEVESPDGYWGMHHTCAKVLSK